MKRLIFIAIWIITSSVIRTEVPYPVFGVRVSIGSNSQINTYVCMINNGQSYAHKRIVDEATFIRFVSGEWPSIYNPERINYFEKYNIDCGVFLDSALNKAVPKCDPFDSLWKIRFSVYPFRNRGEEGWSNVYHKPSPKQEKYLYDRYGVASVDANFFLDTNFWTLMRDVTDPQWIRSYRALR